MVVATIIMVVRGTVAETVGFQQTDYQIGYSFAPLLAGVHLADAGKRAG
jgi:hypothetical protein